MTRQDDIFKKIAESLLVDYSSVYYVNAVTNEYCWYSVNPALHSLSLEQGGDDFFKNIIRDCKKVIYEEDQHIFINLINTTVFWIISMESILCQDNIRAT